MTDNNTNLDNLDIDELAKDLLVKTHSYCVEYSSEQMERVKKHIIKLHDRLEKTVAAEELAKISIALKTQIDLYKSLQEGSVIAFMAQFKPLKNLIEHQKSIADKSSTLDDMGTLDANEAIGDIDISDVYKKYED